MIMMMISRGKQGEGFFKRIDFAVLCTWFSIDFSLWITRLSPPEKNKNMDFDLATI